MIAPARGTLALLNVAFARVQPSMLRKSTLPTLASLYYRPPQNIVGWKCCSTMAGTVADVRSEKLQEIGPNAGLSTMADDGATVSKTGDSAISLGDFEQLPDNLYKTIELELLGYEPEVLNSYQWFLVTAASHLGIEVAKVWSPHKSYKFRFQLLRSAHVHKKHKVHYEVRTYHTFITLRKLTGSTASTYLEYIQRNIPEGIGMKVSKLEVLPKPKYMSQSESSPVRS